MRYFLDEEFIEDGSLIDLVSIGIVAEDGRELYLQSVEFDANNASGWVLANVFPHLASCPHGDKVAHSLKYHGNCSGHDSCPWYSLAQIKHRLEHFMDAEKYGIPELIGWCCAYDFVAFCQLWGTMMDVPTFIPHGMHDIQQILDERGIPDEVLPPQEGTAHNALEDARHIRQIWQWLQASKE